MHFKKSLITSQKIKEPPITVKVTAKGTGFNPRIPKVAIKTPTPMSSTIAVNKVLLGVEFQKCALSLTTNIENRA
jgi:hypothetical protein